MNPEPAKTNDQPVPTKERILQAAQEIFAQKGFDGTSTREIAAQAEVNISSLHYHWDSKEALYLGIIERIQQKLVDLLAKELTVPASNARPRETIERAMGLTFDFLADDPTIPKLLIRRLIESGGISEARDQQVGPTWQKFVDWIRGFSQRGMASEDVTFFILTVQSMLLVLMLDSAHVAAMLGGTIRDPKVRERVRRQVIDLVLKLVEVD
jgi:AcrR family transcriptional regulator